MSNKNMNQHLNKKHRHHRSKIEIKALVINNNVISIFQYSKQWNFHKNWLIEVILHLYTPLQSMCQNHIQKLLEEIKELWEPW